MRNIRDKIPPRARVVDRKTGRPIVTYRMEDLRAVTPRVPPELIADLADLYMLHREWGLFELNHYMGMLLELAGAREARVSLQRRPKARFGSILF